MQFAVLYSLSQPFFKTQRSHTFNGGGVLGMECGKETFAGDEIKAGGAKV